jgi:hypothetical protein
MSWKYFKFPCTIMPPALASRNRCDSFRATFFNRGVAANGVEGLARTGFANRQNAVVFRIYRIPDRNPRDRGFGTGAFG